jgi:xylose isomerase
LRKAVAMQQAGTMNSMLEERYLSWKTDELGIKISQGKATLEECAAYAKAKGEPTLKSGKQELFEMVRNRYLYPGN